MITKKDLEERGYKRLPKPNMGLIKGINKLEVNDYDEDYFNHFHYATVLENTTIEGQSIIEILSLQNHIESEIIGCSAKLRGILFRGEIRNGEELDFILARVEPILKPIN